MGNDPRIDLLRKVNLFSDCTEKQLAFIATRVEDVDVPAGRVLCQEGTSGGEFFVVVSGSAEVQRSGKVIGHMGAGDFFGEIALIDRGPRSATVVASSPMRLLILGTSQFQDVIHQDPEMARQLLYAVTKRLRALAALPVD
ncbi:MAG: cyclic nucleotide-binding domain-containing protein [Chloroflexota bacterium]